MTRLRSCLDADFSSSTLVFNADPIISSLSKLGGKGHAFFGKTDLPIEALAQENLILREHGSGTRAQFEEAMESRSLPINILWECCNSEAILSAVREGHGVSVISRRLVEGAVRDGHLWACPLTGVDFSRTFDLVRHKDKLMTDAMSAFIDLCKTFEA